MADDLLIPVTQIISQEDCQLLPVMLSLGIRAIVTSTQGTRRLWLAPGVEPTPQLTHAATEPDVEWQPFPGRPDVEWCPLWERPESAAA